MVIFLGFKQSGVKNFKLADPIQNSDLFELAEKEIKRIELSELKENSDDFKKEMNTKFEILDKNIPQIDPQIIEKTNNSENIEN